MEIVIQTIYDLPRTAGGLIAAMGGCRKDYALGGVAGTGTEGQTERQASEAEVTGAARWFPRHQQTKPGAELPAE